MQDNSYTLWGKPSACSSHWNSTLFAVSMIFIVTKKVSSASSQQRNNLQVDLHNRACYFVIKYFRCNMDHVVDFSHWKTRKHIHAAKYSLTDLLTTVSSLQTKWNSTQPSFYDTRILGVLMSVRLIFLLYLPLGCSSCWSHNKALIFHINTFHIYRDATESACATVRILNRNTYQNL